MAAAPLYTNESFQTQLDNTLFDHIRIDDDKKLNAFFGGNPQSESNKILITSAPPLNLLTLVVCDTKYVIPTTRHLLSPIYYAAFTDAIKSLDYFIHADCLDKNNIIPAILWAFYAHRKCEKDRSKQDELSRIRSKVNEDRNYNSLRLLILYAVITGVINNRESDFTQYFLKVESKDGSLNDDPIYFDSFSDMTSRAIYNFGKDIRNAINAFASENFKRCKELIEKMDFQVLTRYLTEIILGHIPNPFETPEIFVAFMEFCANSFYGLGFVKDPQVSQSFNYALAETIFHLNSDSIIIKTIGEPQRNFIALHLISLTTSDSKKLQENELFQRIYAASNNNPLKFGITAEEFHGKPGELARVMEAEVACRDSGKPGPADGPADTTAKALPVPMAEVASAAAKNFPTAMSPPPNVEVAVDKDEEHTEAPQKEETKDASV